VYDDNGERAQTNLTVFAAVMRDIAKTYTAACRQKVCKAYPMQPEKPVQKNKRVSLHYLAAKLLADYTQVGDVADFLRSASSALQAVHAVALGLSCIVRRGLGLPVLALEKAAAGRVTSKTRHASELSIFNLDSAQNAPAFGPGEEDTYFSLGFKQYAKEKLIEDYEAGKLYQDGASGGSVGNSTGGNTGVPGVTHTEDLYI